MEDCCKSECSSTEDETCHDEKDDCMSDFFLEIADCAWTDVLKDKIKEYILSTQDKHMTELAKIVAESNNQRWKNKMANKQSHIEFEEKLCQFFGQSKK